MANAADPSWSHVVRGESESTSSPSPSTITTPEPSDRSPLEATVENPEAGPSDSNAAASSSGKGKKPAWNKPSNGLVEVGPVMGAVSWPALSDSTKTSLKLSPSDSLKSLSDGSVSAPLPMNNSNPSSSSNHTRQISSINSGGGSGGGARSGSGGASSSSTVALANGGPSPPSPKSLPTSSEAPHVPSDKPTVPDSSPRGFPNRNSSNWEHGSRGGGSSQPGSDQHRRYGGNRRGHNGGGRGGLHHNYVNRRDLDQGSYQWNNNRNLGNRDAQMQQQQQQRPAPRPYFQPPPPLPPPGTAPYISPPPLVRPFANPMGFPDMPSPVYYVPAPPPHESFRGMHFVAPPSMFFPAAELQVRTELAKQIEYYFSSENLCKDIFLRQNMDDEGWVPISLIANFSRVRQWTNNIQFILETVQASTVVEVQGNKIRRRNDWMSWPLPPPPPLNQFSMSSPQHSPRPNYDSLTARMRSVGLDESAGPNGTRGPSQTEAILSRSSSGDLSSQSRIGALNGEQQTAQTIAQFGSIRSESARSLDRNDTF